MRTNIHEAKLKNGWLFYEDENGDTSLCSQLTSRHFGFERNTKRLIVRFSRQSFKGSTQVSHGRRFDGRSLINRLSAAGIPATHPPTRFYVQMIAE